VTPCMDILWHMGFETAKDLYGRHDIIMSLASWFVFNHMPKDIATQSIFTWMERSGVPYDSRDTARVIEDAYQRKFRFHCDAHIPNQHCQTHCKLYDRKNNKGSSSY
jgi:hypothetical protein